MIKCKKGESRVKGSISDIVAELCCLNQHVAEIVKGNCDDGKVETVREMVSDAFALGLGEKTKEDIFGKMEDSEEDDDIEEDDIEELIDNLFEALVKARK